MAAARQVVVVTQWQRLRAPLLLLLLLLAVPMGGSILRRRLLARHEARIAVVAQLVDRVANVVERAVGWVGSRALAHGRRIPALGKLAHGADIDDAVREVGLQAWHVSLEEALVRVDARASEDDRVRPAVRVHANEGEQRRLGVSERDGAAPAALREP